VPLVIDLSKWEPYDMNEIDDEKYNALKLQFEQLVYMIPADVLRNWQVDLYAKMRGEASRLYTKVDDHMKRS